MINWQKVEQILSKLHNSKSANLAYSPLLMFKILILQVWYNLSDEALEKTKMTNNTQDSAVAYNVKVVADGKRKTT